MIKKSSCLEKLKTLFFIIIHSMQLHFSDGRNMSQLGCVIFFNYKKAFCLITALYLFGSSLKNLKVVLNFKNENETIILMVMLELKKINLHK